MTTMVTMMASDCANDVGGARTNANSVRRRGEAASGRVAAKKRVTGKGGRR